MRLTPYEIASIQEVAAHHFGPGAIVRVFGSRVRDDLRDGDIDLHITADQDLGSYLRSESAFKVDLEKGIGEQRVDVLVNGPGGPVRPIEKIAVLTGRIIGDGAAATASEADPEMLSALHRQMLEDALASGDQVRNRILASVAELAPVTPFDDERWQGMDRFTSLLTESLLLQFSNFVAIVQDQLIRTILLAAGGSVAGMSRADQLRAVQEMAGGPDEPDFARITKIRNRVAHVYPAQLGRQAEIVNEVVEVAPIVARTYDGLAGFARKLLSEEARS